MPQSLTFDFLLPDAAAFSLMTRLPLDGTNGVVVNLATFADAHHVTRLVGVHAAAVADAPIPDEPFHAFARTILDLAAGGSRRSLFTVAVRRLHSFAGLRIDAENGSRSKAFAANHVAIGPIADAPFGARRVGVATLRRRGSRIAFNAAVTFVDERVDVAAEKLSAKYRPESHAVGTASSRARTPFADVPIGRARMRVASAVVLRLQFRFAETIFGDFGRVVFDARDGANLIPAAARLRTRSPTAAADVPREIRRGLVI